MDSFEHLVSEILWMEGYWVRTSFKVELTKEEKVLIGRPSSPRWELDVVAFKGGSNELLVVECKSHLDSRGVSINGFNIGAAPAADRLKLFNDENLRNIVFGRLREQLAACGSCPRDPEIKLCLACGRIASDRDREQLRVLFTEAGWELWDEDWLRARLQKMSDGRYENQVSAVVSKLLLRKPLSPSQPAPP